MFRFYVSTLSPKLKFPLIVELAFYDSNRFRISSLDASNKQELVPSTKNNVLPKTWILFVYLFFLQKVKK